MDPPPSNLPSTPEPPSVPVGLPPAEAVPCVLIVDDVPHNAQLLADLLSFKWGYRTERAHGGIEALVQTERLRPDLILLDVLMPDLDGFEVCRRLRADATFAATPIVLVTSLDAKAERVKGLDAGADDFLSKPIVQAELFARVRSLLRVKSLYDEVSRQRSELAAWSATLERRVEEKVGQIQRLARLKQFFSPRLAARLLEDRRSDLLQGRRREVSVLFADLRGFTAFSEAHDADAVMTMLRAFHAEMGALIHRFEGTLERFTGDGMMVFFNDPDPLPGHALQAVRLGLAMCAATAALRATWAVRGGPSGVAIGISKGVATVGPIGFESRRDYAAIGNVTNLAARLCTEARAGEVLVCAAVWEDVGASGFLACAETLELKGFAQSTRCHRLSAAQQTAHPPPPATTPLPPAPPDLSPAPAAASG